MGFHNDQPAVRFGSYIVHQCSHRLVVEGHWSSFFEWVDMLGNLEEASKAGPFAKGTPG